MAEGIEKLLKTEGDLVTGERFSEHRRVSGMSNAIVGGALAEGLLETIGEIEYVGVAGFRGDLADGETGGPKHLRGAFQPDLFEILLG